MARKNNIYYVILGVIIVLLLVLAYFYFSNYYSKQNKEKEIFSYKQGYYSGVLCEFKCPLIIQDYKNKTELLPDQNCLKECTQSFRENFNGTKLKAEDLNKDNLLKDMALVVKNCRNSALNSSNYKLDNNLFFNCTSNNLVKLKERYSYLV